MKEEKEPIHCANCGQLGTDRFCSHCGQKLRLPRDTFFNLIGDYVANYFAYDGRFVNTVKMLFTKPGGITTAYLQGRRASFLGPMQLYVFCSALFLLVFFSTFHIRMQAKGSFMETATTFGFTPKEIAPKDLDTTYLFPDAPLGSLKAVEVFKSERLSNPLAFTDINEILGYPTAFIADFAYHHQYHNIGQVLAKTYEIFVQSISRMFLLLTPWLAVLTLITFRKKGFLYIDHPIASLHFHVVLFLTFTAMFLLLTLMPVAYIGLFITGVLLLQWLYFILASKRIYRKNLFYTALVGTLTYGFYLFSVLTVAYLYLIGTLHWG